MSSTLGYIDDLLFELYTLHVRCIEKGIGMDPATMSRFVINLDALLVETQIDKVRVRISKMQELLQTHAARSVFPAQKHDVLVPPALDQMETASSREKESTEQLLLERQAREAAQRKCAEMETRLRDREAELLEQIEEMQSELEARRADSGPGFAPPLKADGPSKPSRAQVGSALARARDLQLLMDAARGEEEENVALGELSAGLQALIGSLQAAAAGFTPLSRDSEITELKAAKADAESRYQGLLCNCTGKYVQQRMLYLETSNAALLRKAREDSSLLEARDLKMRPSERKQQNTEQLLLELRAREAAQRECAEMETRLRDREAEMMEQIEEMQCEYEARLEDLGLSLAQGEAESPSESIRTQMEAVRCEEEEGPLSVGLQALIDSLQAAGAGATPSARDISVQALRTL